ncbi:NAD(P)/FAD-dependent oxidoreductase [Leptospira sp. 96542]|nr:NAD(P)/FAD-dependent oxidoreductase [Leptospira sp. 96542]
MPVYLRMDGDWDFIVIGSGMGGLTTASLLAKSGHRVLVLEKGNSPGGCASSFFRKGYLFETGATTLVGLEPNYPLDRLQNMLGIQFPLLTLETPMQVHMYGNRITRFEKKTEWIKEVIKHFGNKTKQKLFWNLCFFISEAMWDLTSRYRLFPFLSWKDVVISLPKFRTKDLLVLLFNLIPILRVLKFFRLNGNEKFIRFLDEQLLITNQTSVQNAPFVSAAAGLVYPNLKNYYVMGGMLALANSLVSVLESYGGKILYKQEVTQFEKKFGVWNVKTKHREFSQFKGTNIISNVPIWNLVDLNPNLHKLKKQASQREVGIWGAFTMGIVLKSKTLGNETCLHHQIHTKHPLPYGGGNSIFVSLSHPDDPVRSPNAIRILSISTHIKNPEGWKRDAVYQNRKKELENSIIKELSNHLDWFREEDILELHSATPVTWFTWTGRKFGRVGGIPSFYFFNPFRYLGAESELENLYLTGDTVFPGQGIPAVVLGGISLYHRLSKRKRG